MDTTALDRSLEYVYSRALDSAGQPYPLKHKVFKQGGTRIYVSRAPGRDEDWRTEVLSRTFVLDRRALASPRGAWSHVTRTRYFLRPELALGPDYVPPTSPALAALGLAPGATLLAIRQAYHRLALLRHPDTGGDATAFQELRAHYEQASREAVE